MSKISDRLQQVRDIAKSELSSVVGKEVEPLESILVSNAKYCGHRFKTRTHTAEWIIDKDLLKILLNDGKQVIKQLDLSRADDRNVVWPNAA